MVANSGSKLSDCKLGGGKSGGKLSGGKQWWYTGW